MNAARKRLGAAAGCELAGRVFVSSGLGGMSGAQAKAATIAGCICLIAEVLSAHTRDMSPPPSRFQRDHKWHACACR